MPRVGGQTCRHAIISQRNNMLGVEARQIGEGGGGVGGEGHLGVWGMEGTRRGAQKRMGGLEGDTHEQT